ncbi:MAG: hypothetical protein MUF84_20685 [Anaerolineae bacterium]|nr:hypothetical protein [Anaerolineae bacterium]
MRRRTHGVVLIVLVLALLLPTSTGLAEPEYPLELEGVLKGAPYIIRVPENWNGKLLVFVSPKADFDAAFLAEDELLMRGYALAATAGRSVGVAMDEITLDAKYLTDFFMQKVGKPERTVVYGISAGGIITLLSMEKFPGTYDAGIPMCAPAAGVTRNIALRFSIALAYDAAFGWPASWGLVEDLRDDLNFVTDVRPTLLPQVLNPANFARWEFVRLANDLPLAGYYTNPFPWPDLPPGVIMQMLFATDQRVQWEVAAGGRVSQNVGYVYSLSDAEKAYLQGLESTLDLDAMLAQMNAMTGIQAEPRALAYLSRVGEHSGRVHGPILMAHNALDAIAPVEHTTEYANLMASVGTQDLLTRVYVGSMPGHCNFTKEQVLAMFDAVDAWLETGNAPGPEAFPGELGFAQGFEPGPWPQPPQD